MQFNTTIGATQLLEDALGKPPSTTVVVIDEVDVDNWGMGGETITGFRQKYLNK